MAKPISTKAYGLIVKINVVAILVVVLLWCITAFMDGGNAKEVLYLIMIPFGLYALFASFLMIVVQIQYFNLAKKKQKKEQTGDSNKPID